ncbi:MAG: hypothetical protein EAZ27_13470 [Cytophagales bacterium]|nr:MAG: hypothetical protein EAZ27_13470 [Cytophagales bacterium]
MIYRTDITSEYIKFPNEKKMGISVENQINKFFQSLKSFQTFTQNNITIYFHKLKWDSDFFGFNSIAIKFVDYPLSTVSKDLIAGLQKFKSTFFEPTHIYIDIPLKESKLIQILSLSGFQKVETRLNYIHYFENHLETIYKYKLSDPSMANVIGNIAKNNINKFDRFHSDSVYLPDKGNDFLYKYAFECAMGNLADDTLVPAQVPIDSFMSLKYSELENKKIASIKLSAVGENNRGWHIKLLNESLNLALEKENDFTIMRTQATNQAVITNSECLNFNLYQITEIYSFNNFCTLSLQN